MAPKKVKCKGYIDDMDDKQREVLEELKDHIKTQMTIKTHPTIYDDWYILRF